MAESPVVRTTRWLAFSLMALFAVCLITALVVAVRWPDERWMTTFKDGFAFLAGSLATIVGYYFGNRNTDVALERAKEATDRADTASEAAKQTTDLNDVLKRELIEAASQDDSVAGIRSPVIVESGLVEPPRPPKKGD